MSGHSPVAFLFDVDNTLIDSDRIIDDLRRHLSAAFGADETRHYWKILEALQDDLGYPDYLGALQRYGCENPCNRHFLKLSLHLLDYPFADRLFPRAMDVVAYSATRGLVAIVSDGDVVFQPRKIERSGLLDAVDGRVLIYIQKEKEFEDIQRNFPARHYVIVDDRPKELAAAKKAWKARVTTVFVRQGRQASDPQNVEQYPEPDLSVPRIGDLLEPGCRALFEHFG